MNPFCSPQQQSTARNSIIPSNTLTPGFTHLWTAVFFSPQGALLGFSVLNSPSELARPTLCPGSCKHCGFFPYRLEQTSDHQTGFAAWASWQTTSSPSTLGRGASVIGHVCYVHKCPISSWTGVNPTTVVVQRQPLVIPHSVCLPEGINLPGHYYSTDSLLAGREQINIYSFS